jgi:hypothetical protein
MKHAHGWTGMLGLVGMALVSTAALAARHSGRAAPNATIVWVNPQKLTPTDRAALTRLLTEAAAGQRLLGFRVRDSRPQITAPTCRPVIGRLAASSRNGGRPPTNQARAKTVRLYNLQSPGLPADTTDD